MVNVTIYSIHGSYGVVRAKKLKTKQWAGLSALKGCTITAVLSAALGCPRGIYISYGQWHMYIGDLP